MRIVELPLVSEALADGSGRRYGTRPTAALHSVADVVGRTVGWGVGTDEHCVDGRGQGREREGATGD